MKNSLFIFFDSAIFLVAYIFLFVIIRNISPDDIVFYQGIHLLEILLLIFISFYFFRFRKLEYLVSKLPSIFIGFLLSYSFLMTLPVVIDRSITLHFLAYLSSHPSASVDEIRSDFVDKFVFKSAAIEKRIAEQSSIGNIDLIDGSVSISNKGLEMHYFFHFLANVFKVKTTYSES